jgi:mono/diheme cytochrome c family protein
VSQAGEYVYDQPHLLSTRRIGPDLMRVGRKYGDDWHTAHHWNPRDVVPDSIMPRFPWLYNDTGHGPPQLNDDGKALVAYLQRLGTSIGDWRETFVSTRLAAGAALQMNTPQETQDMVNLGRQVYYRRCVGCHGVKGDGNGVSARFLNPRPRNFTTGIFKFRSTEGVNSLPSDQDLFITVTHGLWGTAMPPWYSISSQERLAVIQFIKTFSTRWQSEKPGAAIVVPDEPAVTAASIANGKQLFETVCNVCHGDDGRGDGPAAAGLTDVWNNPVRPANFTLPAGVPGGVTLGHDGPHIFKTVMTGVGGTPMPAFEGTFTAAQVWDIAHFVQSLRVDAEVAEIKQASLENQQLPAMNGFCTSNVNWIRKACDKVILPVVKFCSLDSEVPTVGYLLPINQQLAATRRSIWSTLSEAAQQDRIDARVVNVDELPDAIAANNSTNKGPSQ